MLQQYYGGDAVTGRYSPPIHRSKPALPQFHLFSGFGPRKKHQGRSVSLDVPLLTAERVRVNVSGKKFEFSGTELAKYPGSLLSNPGLSGKYYDQAKQEYFFDRSRIAFECIYNFYYTNGRLVEPENYPEQLLVDEMQFFGLYEYLEPKEKEHLIKPSNSVTKVITPDNKWQRKLWELMEHPETSIAARIISIVTLVSILVSVVILCMETWPSLRLKRNTVLDMVISLNATNSTGLTKKQLLTKTWELELFVSEAVCISYFTLELLLRFCASPIKRQFWRDVMNIIDLIAVVPFYITLFLEKGHTGAAVAALRILRLSRVFRILKISRYVSGMKVLGQTLSEAISDLWMICFLTIIGTILFGSCVYYFEQLWDPGTAFESIPISLWWAIITISTVGYGDMAPRTLAGKITGAMCAISGILLIAPLLPILYQRWERYYLLDQQGKIIKAAEQKRREIEKSKGKSKPSKTIKKDPATKERPTVEEKIPELAEVKPDHDQPFKTDPAAGPSTRAIPKRGRPRSPGSKTRTDMTSSDIEDLEMQISEDDDEVWAHIRKASLKRKRSQSSFSNLPKPTAIKESVASPASPKIKVVAEVNYNPSNETAKEKCSTVEENAGKKTNASKRDSKKGASASGAATSYVPKDSTSKEDTSKTSSTRCH